MDDEISYLLKVDFFCLRELELLNYREFILIILQVDYYLLRVFYFRDLGMKKYVYLSHEYLYFFTYSLNFNTF